MKISMWLVAEGIIVFTVIWLFNYFGFVKVNKKLNKDDMPLELIYLVGIWKIDPNKINYKRFQITFCFLNAFIITTTYLLVFYLIDNLFYKIVLWVVLLSLFIVICYGLLGKYYLYKEKKYDKKSSKNSNDTKKINNNTKKK